MQQPPLLPEETLARVLRAARFNGMSVMVVSGIFALISAVAKDPVGAVAGLVVAGAGAMEVHGGSVLDHGYVRGMRWLVWSQLLCLGAILAYCGVRYAMGTTPPLPEELRPAITADAEQLGMTAEELILRSYRLGLFLVATLSLIYQGGMAIYYLRRQAPVAQALETGANDAYASDDRAG